MVIKIFNEKGEVLSYIKHYTGHYKIELLKEALGTFLDKLQNPNFSKILLKIREIEKEKEQKNIDKKLSELEKKMSGTTLIYYGRKAYTIAKEQNQIAINGIKSMGGSTNPLKKLRNTEIYDSFKYGIDNAIDLTPYRVLSNQPPQSHPRQ